MALTISKLQLPITETNMLSNGFRNLLENHLAIIKNGPGTIIKDLAVHDEYMYIGDFYSLLYKYQVAQDLFWLTMRLNGLHTPIDYKGDLLFIYVPSLEIIKTLLRRYLNTVTIR